MIINSLLNINNHRQSMVQRLPVSSIRAYSTIIWDDTFINEIMNSKLPEKARSMVEVDLIEQHLWLPYVGLTISDNIRNTMPILDGYLSTLNPGIRYKLFINLVSSRFSDKLVSEVDYKSRDEFHDLVIKLADLLPELKHFSEQKVLATCVHTLEKKCKTMAAYKQSPLINEVSSFSASRKDFLGRIQLGINHLIKRSNLSLSVSFVSQYRFYDNFPVTINPETKVFEYDAKSNIILGIEVNEFLTKAGTERGMRIASTTKHSLASLTKHSYDPNAPLVPKPIRKKKRKDMIPQSTERPPI